jgi:hypothetical protein
MDQGDIVTSGPSSTLINDQRVLDLVRGAIDGSAFAAATAEAVG